MHEASEAEIDPFVAPFVGRRSELDLIGAARDHVRSSGSTAVLIRGEAGIGKSRLLAEALGESRAAGFQVVHGQADHLERRIPYAAFRNAMRSLLECDEASAVHDLVRDLDQALEVQPVSGGEERPNVSVVHQRVGRLFEALCDRRPTVLALDDLHDADEDTIVLLLTVFRRRLASAPLLVVTTMRTSFEPVEALDEFVARAESPLVHAIELDALTDAEISDLLRGAIASAPPDDALTRMVALQSRGSPFFAIETYRSLSDSGRLRDDGNVTRLADDAPAAIVSRRGALLQRIFPLGRDARAVANAASAFSRIRVSHLALVAAVASMSLDQVDSAFDRLVRAQILRRRDDDGFEFAHAIVADTLYDNLGPAERHRLHSAIARQMLADRRSGAYVDGLELAHHVAESAEVGDTGAVDVLLEAGDRMAGTAPRTACHWYQRALVLLVPGDRRRWEVLSRYAFALHRASRTSEAVAAGRLALATMPTSADRKRMVALVAEGLGAMGDQSEVLALLDRETTGTDDARLLVLKASALEQLGRNEDSAAEAQRALASSTDDTTDRALALFQLAQLAVDAGDIDTLRELIDEQRRIAEHLSAGARLNVYAWGSYQLAGQGLVHGADEMLGKARALGGELGSMSHDGPIEVASLLLDWHRGAWDAALDRTWSVGRQLEETHQFAHAALLNAIGAEIALGRGDLDHAEELLGHQKPVSLLVDQFRGWVRAGLMNLRGDTSGACDVLDQMLRGEAPRGPFVYLLRSRLIDIAVAEGEATRAATVLDALVHEARTQRRPLACIHASLGAAIVRGNLDAARKSFELATKLQLPWYRARAQLVLGRLGDDAEANLTQALDTFRELGAEPWRRDAAAGIRGAGLKVPRWRMQRATELTEAESQIAKLVWEGLKNREIAEVLSYSPKTVEAYLSRVYAKTGCRSRADLVRYLSSAESV